MVPRTTRLFVDVQAQSSTLLLAGMLLLSACDCAEPDLPQGLVVERPDGAVWLCREGDQRCQDRDTLQVCVADGEFLRAESIDCSEPGLVCVPGLWCVLCEPGAYRCRENDVQRCTEDGMAWEVLDECDRLEGEICHHGECVDECDLAVEERSNVGCEYFAVDLDNASITVDEDASAQQFAVAVSNTGDVPATVRVYRNDAEWGEATVEDLVEEAIVPNGDLHVFELPRREVDGTPDGMFDWQGQTPGSKLSGRAYRIQSTHRVVAYQYNPRDNVQVFSNDSSLLLPTSALDDRYVVLSWPQTIAKTDDPSTNACEDEEDNPFCDGLRTFLTVVGTEDATEVTLTLKARPVPVPELPDEDIRVNVPFVVTLGRYEVLNLETDGFNDDFTGSTVEATRPVAVFAGSEASDVPFYETRSTRFCCADHLEEQMLPYSALGTTYAGTIMPARTPAVRESGARVALVVEPEWFRVMAVEGDCRSRGGDDVLYTNVTTTLPPPDDQFRLPPCGVRTIRAEEDFHVSADHRIAFGQYVAGQKVTGIPVELPGGDPVFVMVPPLEQWRERYVFLVPDLYAFDFMTVIAPSDARILFDGTHMPAQCALSFLPGPRGFDVYKCQLSFPRVWPREIDTETNRARIDHVDQADGIHSISADEPVGLLLYGFDAYVSYGNAGGTDVRRIEP